MIDPAPAKTDSNPDPAHPGPEPKKPLSPEEQMEQFEEDLKESDWGHQPC